MKNSILVLSILVLSALVTNVHAQAASTNIWNDGYVPTSPCIVVYNGYIYCAKFVPWGPEDSEMPGGGSNNPDTYILKLDAQTYSVVKSVDLGTFQGGESHLDPYLYITPTGTIWVLSGYYSGGLKYWTANVNDMIFTEHDAPINGYSYPFPFTLNNKLYLLMRASSSLVVVDTSTWNILPTIWTWSGGLQSACYYASYIVDNGRLYVAAVGPRPSGIIEQRDNVYFAWTSDAVTWHAASGNVVDTPELAYDGFTSRVSIAVSNGEPYIASAYYGADTGADLFLIYHENGAWKNTEIPTDGYPVYEMGWGCIQVISGVVHVFHGVEPTLDALYSYGTVMHFWASPPYTSWSSEQISNSYMAWCDPEVDWRGSDLLVTYHEEGGQQYIYVFNAGGFVIPRNNVVLYLIAFGSPFLAVMLLVRRTGKKRKKK